MTTLISESTQPVPDLPPEPRQTEGSPAPRLTREEVAEAAPVRRPGVLVVVWMVVALAIFVLVLYVLEPFFQTRTQDELLTSYRAELTQAANEASTVLGVTTPTKAPELGAPIGIVEIGGLRVQQVVVEGVTPSQTQAGPGHVPGTAAPGQPGNSAIVGRRAMYGGPFGDLGSLQEDDPIVVTTTQGQAVYEVVSVERRTIVEPLDEGSTGASAATGVTNEALAAAADDEPVITVDELYGPTADDRLTLVTSDSALPWNADSAVVVIAGLVGQPYEPTPQNGRTDSQTGLDGDPSAWAPFVLAMAGLVGSAVAAVWLYRRVSTRVAYLLTTPALVVFAILAAETASHLLPAWA